MAPRGIKKILKETVPAKLVGSGKWKAFEPLHQGKPTGAKLRGLTKALETCGFSDLYSESAMCTADRVAKPSSFDASIIACLYSQTNSPSP